MRLNLKTSLGALVLLSACATDTPRDRRPNFIGGDRPNRFVPGIVKMGGQAPLDSCTATLVSPRHILTAAHCSSNETIASLLSTDLYFPPPFQTKIDLYGEDGSFQSHTVTVKKIHMFPEIMHREKRRDFERIADKDVAQGKILETGDVAIVELETALDVKFTLPKILFQKKPTSSPLLIGGFGRKTQDKEDFRRADYTGGRARFGKLRNSFFYWGSPDFNLKSEVSVEVLNVDKEITFFGKGDSGAALFRQSGTQWEVVGVVHGNGSGLPSAEGLWMDARSGKVLERPDVEFGDLVGFAHYFGAQNKVLLDWISKILPESSFRLEN